jgi:formylglycine-generating enzyme required for sulfatase activity
VGVCLASPQVDVVGLGQDGSRAIRVRYEIGNDPVVVTVDFLTNGVSIGESNFRNVSGDVNRIVSGAGEHTILWSRPHREWTNHVINDQSFTAVVTAWATNAPPDYLAVDLMGADVPRYYVSTNALPYPISSKVWRTSKILLRRIHAKGETFLLGSTADERNTAETVATERAGSARTLNTSETMHRVTFSDDFYIGVFEFTLGQYKALYGSYSGLTSRAMNFPESEIYPLTQQSYNAVRGSFDNNVRWPQTGRGTVGGHMAKLREATGDIGFDLPTEWQWEVACKAGVQGILYSGEEYSDEALHRLAWVSSNSSTNINGTTQRELHPVGGLQPNAWGLYDMIGNATECMVNVWVAIQKDGPYVDPVGPEAAADSTHTRRGGRFVTVDLRSNRPASRDTTLTGAAPTATSSEDGFRVICPVGLYWN